MKNELKYDTDLGNGMTVRQYIAEERKKGVPFSKISNNLRLYYEIDICTETLRRNFGEGNLSPMDKGIRGYCCPKCGSAAVRSGTQIPHIDDIVRNKSCYACGYEWKTVEVDIDFFNLMVFGTRDHAEIDLRGKRTPKKGGDN